MNLGYFSYCIALLLTSQLFDVKRNHLAIHLQPTLASQPPASHPNYRRQFNFRQFKRDRNCTRPLRNARYTATATPVYLILSVCLFGRRNLSGFCGHCASTEYIGGVGFSDWQLNYDATSCYDYSKLHESSTYRLLALSTTWGSCFTSLARKASGTSSG
jgi:hypothetical protein